VGVIAGVSRRLPSRDYGACVEAGVWRTSSHNGSNGNCIEVGAWRKASRSGTNGDRVEVAPESSGAVAVRDAKDPRGPMLVFAPGAWRAFTDRVRAGDPTA
jgi:hypothetical protein